MIDLVFARSDLLDDATFHAIRAGVPPGRRERCDAYHRRADRHASVDVQGAVPFDDGLFDRMVAPGEQGLRERLRHSGDLSPLWTRKEALVKRTGRGLATPLSEVDTMVAPELCTFSHDDLGVRLSISCQGLDDAGGARLRMRRFSHSPGSGVWRPAPDRGFRRLAVPA